MKTIIGFIMLLACAGGQQPKDDSVAPSSAAMQRAQKPSRPLAPISSLTGVCQNSTATWQNMAVATQADTFTAEFDATPSADSMGAAIGLSNSAADAFSDLAAIVQFWTDGTIQARNGGVYQPANPVISYSAGLPYHFRLVVNITAHTYEAYVKQGAGTELLIGSGLAFRTEQAAVTSLNNVGFNANLVGSVTVCDPVVVAPPPPPPPDVVDGCPTSGYLRAVNVSTATQLNAAITAALAGDQIRLAPGTYTGFRTLSASGTATNPITLCGPKTANIGGTGTAPTGMNLKLTGNYWVLTGFKMSSVFQPIFVIGGDWNVIRNLEIANSGNSGIRLKNQATHNVIDSSYIHYTGLDPANVTYGEGIYIGTANSKWCAENGCNPDRSDSNTVSRNTVGPNISAEMINVKDGVTGTRKFGNHYNGAGKGNTGQVAFVHDFGSRGFDSANVSQSGTNPTKWPNGYYIEQVGLAAGASTVGYPWGQYNVVMYDTIVGPDTTGFGFRVGGGSRATTTVKCNNQVTGFTGGMSNLPPTYPVCTP